MAGSIGGSALAYGFTLLTGLLLLWAGWRWRAAPGRWLQRRVERRVALHHAALAAIRATRAAPGTADRAALVERLDMNEQWHAAELRRLQPFAEGRP